MLAKSLTAAYRPRVISPELTEVQASGFEVAGQALLSMMALWSQSSDAQRLASATHHPNPQQELTSGLCPTKRATHRQAVLLTHRVHASHPRVQHMVVPQHVGKALVNRVVSPQGTLRVVRGHEGPQQPDPHVPKLDLQHMQGMQSVSEGRLGMLSYRCEWNGDAGDVSHATDGGGGEGRGGERPLDSAEVHCQPQRARRVSHKM